MCRLRQATLLIAILTLTAIGGSAAGVESPSALSSVGSQTRETELGDLVADAARSAAGTPVALIPAGSLREITIPKGQVKTDEVLKCLQYPDDQVVVIELTGDQLTRALERSVSIYPQKNMGFLQVSGLVFAFNPKDPKGSRVSSVTVGRQKVANERRYRVATTKPLADGAYGYFTVWGSKLPRELKGKTVAQAVSVFLSQRSSVDYRAKNRILLKKE